MIAIPRIVSKIAATAALLAAGTLTWLWWRLGRPIAFDDLLADADAIGPSKNVR